MGDYYNKYCREHVIMAILNYHYHRKLYVPLGCCSSEIHITFDIQIALSHGKFTCAKAHGKLLFI